MGAAASIQGQGQLTLEEAKQLAGKFWNQAQWDKFAVDGVLHRTKFKEVIRGADPEFIWALYDQDNSGCIQASELSKILFDLDMGEGDVDLDTALAEMEMDEMDDNMDGKLEKAEFLKWLASKKAELAEMEPSKAAVPAKSGPRAGVNRDANAWGSEPKHHLAATKIQSIERGRRVRKPVVDGEIEVIDEGNEQLQDRAARKIQAHARGRLIRKVYSDRETKNCGTDL